MDSTVLQPDELRELLGCARHQHQREVLEQHGIPFVVRRDGSIAVAREFLSAWARERMSSGSDNELRIPG